MVEVFKNIITPIDIQNLLDYFNIDDNRVDTRPDVISKHPIWDVDVWPQSIIERILNTVLKKLYSVEEVIYNRSKISFGLHADSGRSNQSIYKAILIPLEITDFSGTVFFNNYWPYTSAKFTHQPFDPLVYTLFDCENNPVKVKLDKFLRVRDFNRFPNYSDDYISNLIQTRLTGNRYSTTDNRTNEYEKIIGYVADKQFDTDIYNQYLHHINYNDLTGLTLDKIVPWHLGEVIVFDRTQLHCATAGHKFKTGITIFTDTD